MSVAVKMRPTEQVEVVVKGPGKKKKTYSVPMEIARQVESLVAVNQINDFVSAEEVFPELKKATERVAGVLRGFRYREELTQAELAKKMGVKQHHLSEMEHGKRSIGKNLAKKLAKQFKTDYRIFL